MTVLLSRGQDNVLETEHIMVSVRHSAAVDLSALLLTAKGMVRTDADLVFYNQPLGEGVRLVRTTGEPSALVMDLGAVPADIDHVRVVVTLDDQQDGFDKYAAPDLRIDDAAGNRLCDYVIDGVGAESTVVAVDFDRNEYGWQLRPLGQGYADGFAALITAHGVEVGHAPRLVVQRLPAEELPEPLSPSELATRPEITLCEPGGAELSHVKMALGWDPVREPGRFGLREADIDLDASALVFSGRELLDAAFYGQLSSKDGAVRHQGDNLTGAGNGEMISVDLTRLPGRASTVFFVVTSYAGHTFERVHNAYWRLVDGGTDLELSGGNLRVGGNHTGMVVAKVQRTDEIWRFRALGAPIQAGHPVEAAEQVAPYL
ncbi:TerD family protein [Nocardia altamirensis]|uniref:TerD family protein n=1 Tax=Nocardia altamirensis TaxID=472158 RepID=UPI00084020BC|nr:TerD family protein [Nocardia altamirensis]